MISRSLYLAAGILAANAFFVSAANAAAYTGTVTMLEIWPNGNVAFSMWISGPTGLPCNGQAVINQHLAGTKNMYAALLGAKLAARKITMNSTACGPADDYSPSVLYNLVDYLYVLD